MDFISDEDLDNVPVEVIEKSKEIEVTHNPKEIEELVLSENITVDSLTNLAATAYHYLKQEMAKEMTEKKTLSDKTRRWFETLTTTLEKLHRAKYGDKMTTMSKNKISIEHIHTILNTRGETNEHNQ